MLPAPVLNVIITERRLLVLTTNIRMLCFVVMRKEEVTARTWIRTRSPSITGTEKYREGKIAACVIEFRCIPLTSRILSPQISYTDLFLLFSQMGAGDNSVVERRTRGRKVVCSIPGQSGWENFLLQGQLSVLTLTSVSVPPLHYRSSM